MADDGGSSPPSLAAEESEPGRFGFLPTGTELGIYVGIECLWHVSLFSVCYRYRPLVALGKTPWGRNFLKSTKSFLASKGGRMAAVGSGTTAFLESPWKRATTEWFFFVSPRRCRPRGAEGGSKRKTPWRGRSAGRPLSTAVGPAWLTSCTFKRIRCPFHSPPRPRPRIRSSASRCGPPSWQLLTSSLAR